MELLSLTAVIKSNIRKDILFHFGKCTTYRSTAWSQWPLTVDRMTRALNWRPGDAVNYLTLSRGGKSCCETASAWLFVNYPHHCRKINSMHSPPPSPFPISVHISLFLLKLRKYLKDIQEVTCLEYFRHLGC